MLSSYEDDVLESIRIILCTSKGGELCSLILAVVFTTWYSPA